MTEKNQNLKGSYRALSEEQERNLIVDYEDGHSINDISVMYKIAIRTVHRTLERYRVPLRDNPRRRHKPDKLTYKPRKLKPCGTVAAYRRHKRAKELPCTACLEANALDVRIRRKTKPRKLKPCGTVAAHRRHYRNGEKPCRACMDAKNKAAQKLRRKRRSKK